MNLNQPSLLCRVGAVIFVIPAEDVVETMRPLPVEPIPGAPGFIKGVSVIRGAPQPVVSVARLFDMSDAEERRLVIVRAGAHNVALAVNDVVALRSLLPSSDLPPLLQGASRDIVAKIGTLHGALLAVLETSRIVPEEVFLGFSGADAS